MAGECVVEGLGGERVLKAGTKYQGIPMNFVSNVLCLVSFQSSWLTRCPGAVTTIHQPAVESLIKYPVWGLRGGKISLCTNHQSSFDPMEPNGFGSFRSFCVFG